MELKVIKNEEWQEIAQRLQRIELALEIISKQQPAKQQKDWIPLTEFLTYSTISRASWYRDYQFKIKYRNDGVKIWVNVPSYEAYLEEKAINKKAA